MQYRMGCIMYMRARVQREARKPKDVLSDVSEVTQNDHVAQTAASLQ